MTVEISAVGGASRLNSKCESAAHVSVLLLCAVISVLPLSDLTLILLLFLGSDIAVTILLCRDVLKDRRVIWLTWWKIRLESTRWEIAAELTPLPQRVNAILIRIA
jgi:hypothetical protein